MPLELAGVVMKLMAKDPADRFHDMRTVGQALLPFASSEFDWPMITSSAADHAFAAFA